MKMFVITNARGKVIGSYRPNPVVDPKAPVFRPVASSVLKQQVHEIEAPEHLSDMTSVSDLHTELAKLIKRPATGRRPGKAPRPAKRHK